MMFFLVLTVLLTVVTGAPYNSQRIVGGTITDIAKYPFQACLLFSWNGIIFLQSCGGTILTYRSVLTAAHCLKHSAIHSWRTRVGSTYASSGGVVHLTQKYFTNPEYDEETIDNDIAVLYTATKIVFNNNVSVGKFAGTHYNLPDNAEVWAIGWGRTSDGGASSEQLRHVQLWVINHDICRTRYKELNYTVTDNMLCSGWLDVGGRDQCQGDSGGPLIHNNIIVGVCSWGESCALPRYPGVNARVSRFRAFIQNNA